MWPYVSLVVVFGAVFWYRLRSLTHGYSPREVGLASASTNVHVILQTPVDAPYRLIVYVLSKLHHNPLLMARLTSVALGLLTLILFFGLLQHWYGRRTALWGTVLFGMSAWLLHTARLGTPEILQSLGILALIACHAWMRHTRSAAAVLAGFVLCGLLLYIPGMAWFIVLGVVWQIKIIDDTFKKNLWAVSVSAVLLLGMLTPLGLAIHNNPTLGKALVGFPDHGLPVVIDSFKRLSDIPQHLFLHNAPDAERWLGTVPIFDFFTTAMIFLGGYLYLRHIKLARVHVSLFVIVLGAVLASLGGIVTLSVIIPILYAMAAGGVGFMMDRWLTVFPRNVIAKTTGYTLLGLAVGTACWYSAVHYFVAWPHAPATRSVFIVQDTATSGTIKK